MRRKGRDSCSRIWQKIHNQCWRRKVNQRRRLWRIQSQIFADAAHISRLSIKIWGMKVMRSRSKS
uniref:Uncharacterized protein n=1 Tax=Lutzomyia longipalpis TaxID=7200 RepID=A0A1B0GIT2_LUTLO